MLQAKMSPLCLACEVEMTLFSQKTREEGVRRDGNRQGREESEQYGRHNQED